MNDMKPPHSNQTAQSCWAAEENTRGSPTRLSRRIVTIDTRKYATIKITVEANDKVAPRAIHPVFEIEEYANNLLILG